MNFDALTTAAIREELTEKVLGGRVQKVLFPSEDSLALEVYANRQTHWLLASIHPQHARVHLSNQRFQRMVERESPLLLLLRKYVRDGRITHIEQIPLERVLILTIAKWPPAPNDEEKQPTGCKLIIEIMGRYSNIILTDAQGVVLDCVKRIYPQMNRYRVMLPHHQYVPPPPQAKLPPDHCSPATLASILRHAPASKPMWQALVEGFRAVSPLLAREIAYRATGNADTSVEAVVATADATEAVSGILQDIFQPLQTHRWQPCLAGQDNAPVAFAPYRLTHLTDIRLVGSISGAVATFYASEETARPHQLSRLALQRLIDEERERLVRKKESLQREVTRAAEASKLRACGGLILTYASQIQAGQTVLQVDGLTVELDPRLTPVENAQAYFHEYAKAKAARDELPALLDQTQVALAYLDEMSGLVDLAEDQKTIAALREELAEAGVGGKQEAPAVHGPKGPARAKHKERKTKVSPLKLSVDGFEVWVGRSGRENDEVTFKIASGDDLWLHARGVPGAHVIVRTSGGEPEAATMRRIAEIAARYSQARNSKKVAVDCTRRKHVRRVKGAPPGLVTYTNETTFMVKPAENIGC